MFLLYHILPILSSLEAGKSGFWGIGRTSHIILEERPSEGVESLVLLACIA